MYLTYYVTLVGIKKRNCLQQVIYAKLFSKVAKLLKWIFRFCC